MSSPAPGWYADPGGSAEFRWWDGRSWTDALSPDREAAAPVDARPTGGPGRPHRRLRPLALTVALSLVALVAIGVGGHLVTTRAEDRTQQRSPATGRSDPAPTPPVGLGSGAATPAPVPGSLDEETRMATLGRGPDRVSMRLPDAPYTLVPQPKQIGHSFDVAFFSNAVVHPTRGDRPLWVSTVALAHVPASAVDAGTPSVVAGAAMADLLRAFYPADAVGPVDEKMTSCMVTGGEPAHLLTARVRYDVPGLPSRFDRLTVLLLARDDGSFVVALSTVPDDAPAEHTTLAAAALATLAVG